ncbi:CinA family protein [Oxalobacter formigenes]|jgi:nicotinamide-nucleotide amidase|uniref:Competence/damage-inducible domain protein CinA n=1 Tax=Oxalobacter formigenes OXCC13 TaxID=556269 RepID=C3XBF6_OXAFO|nr:CinA family protein [Oxalobacter formigenes]ARQ45301.1 Nicotinamide-nucleotide amidohydrolase PncC [Oxalobacter formigenes]ARQ77591.1 damage-inducible protein CinA [Oxalobacter formigenes OXCC13]EEO30532.1 competence/damage-inducible domain protein CinA [Oxalobacter formigenes OXCC13]MCZ4063707.1 CinA family protein [Oxalobacter formigenes]QDX33869.1 CinA family protein [Oxalobacter formigenes]
MTPYELAQRIGFLLSQKKLKLAIVESCTGGSLAKLVTDVPGASEWFDCGFITYSNESKIRSVNVPEELIAQNGAVSQKVALAMAKGGLDVTNADIVISTTGIAGPDGGSLEKPVGTVCFGFATKESYFSTDKQLFDGDRSKIREKSVIYSLECLCNYLETGHF